MAGYLKERKRLVLSDLKGADFSSSIINVAPNRATKMTNLINKGGVNCKRNSWDQKADLGGRINGIWSMADDVGNSYIIVHSGTSLFRFTSAGFSDKYELSTGGGVVTDERSFAVANNNKLYIFCGDYFVFDPARDNSAVIVVRNDELTYIPTTVHSLSYDGDAGDLSGTLDAVNVLSDRLINGFRMDVSTPRTYTVNTGKMDDGDVIVRLTLQGGGESVYTAPAGSDTLLGLGSVDRTTGKVTVGQIPANAYFGQDGNDNMTVEFTYLARDKNGTIITDYAKRVTECAIGALFGVGGNNNRIFISGNTRFKNIVFYSDEDDFTYFPDLNFIALGTTASPVMGFSTISDGSLAIHKGESIQESSIYYITGVMQDVYDDHYDDEGVFDGRIVVAQEAVFPVKSGASGEYSVSMWANASVSGDSVFLSRNGLFGIEPIGNISTDERYARVRSSLVNGRLRRENLHDAAAISHEGKYFLSVGNGAVYVADSRFKTGGTDNITNYEYEWWYWDNVHARTWAEISGALIFGTIEGYICAFSEVGFYDVSRHTTEAGEMSIDYAGNRIQAYADLKELLNASDSVIFSGDLIEDAEGEPNNLSGETLFPVGIEEEEGQDDETYLYFKVSKIRGGEPIIIYNPDSNEEDTESLDLVAIFETRFPVKCEWQSAAFNMGTSEYLKTLLGLSITPEPHSTGSVVFGYSTRIAVNRITTRAMYEWSFADIDFSNFIFGSERGAFAFSEIVRVRERSFNYIMFRYESETSDECAVNNISATYRISERKNGVY
ncbi:hypothetical protein FACS1894211_12740 [Clostridia bacterium]|nr:hypothetical protein FACS1894211_12740 [Clostridia bacterium]